MSIKLRDIPHNIVPKGLRGFLEDVRDAIKLWGGSTVSRKVSYQDLIDLELIDSDGNRIDDNGDPI